MTHEQYVIWLLFAMAFFTTWHFGDHITVLLYRAWATLIRTIRGFK